MPSRTTRTLATALVAAGLLAEALADTLVLDNGDRITGSFTEVRAGHVHFTPDYSDQTIAIPMERIARLETDDAIRLVLEDGTEVQGRAVEADAEGHIRLDSDELTEPFEVSVAQLDRATGPDALVREPVRTSGDITLGARVTDGDPRTRAVNGAAVASLRSDANRVRFNAEYNRAQEDGALSEDNAAGGIRYDHFMTDNLYLNTSASLGRARFRDLRLRTTVGGGLGYQFFDTGQFSLSAELGVSYVNEDFYEAPNEENPAARWGIDYEQRFAGNGIRLFHTQEGLVNLEAAADTRVSTRTGIRFPFVVGMTGTFQINYDYQNRPPGDTRRGDTAYIFSLGYTW